jgi:hypothetical protein
LNPLLVDQKSKLSPDKQLQAALAVADKLGLKVMVDWSSTIAPSTPT